MLDVHIYVYLLPREIHTTIMVGFVISLNDDIFTREASKDKLHISRDHFRYLCSTALFLTLAIKEFHVGMES